MVLDQELVKRAKAAGSRLAEAERQAQLARADYHTLVRRMHLAGGSLREIAQELTLSYQRVQQIVDAAGGTWWKRIWRTRNVKRDAVCTFCGRPPSEVAKLIAGPNVYICDECVAFAEHAVAGHASARRESRAPSHDRGRDVHSARSRRRRTGRSRARQKRVCAPIACDCAARS
jgi:ribosome-binding protein aMBF1 (putative translation factor)